MNRKLKERQYKMPKKLLKVQNMLFHLMPNSAFSKMGFKKSRCYHCKQKNFKRTLPLFEQFLLL